MSGQSEHYRISVVKGEVIARPKRRYVRENIVLRVMTAIGDDYPLSSGLVDLSIGGARIKLDSFSPPLEGRMTTISIEALKLRLNGVIKRAMPVRTGVEVAIEFQELHHEVPGKLLEYKLRSYSKFDGGKKKTMRSEERVE